MAKSPTLLTPKEASSLAVESQPSTEEGDHYSLISRLLYL